MDHRDIVAHERQWYRRLDENRMVAIVELYEEDDDGGYEEDDDGEYEENAEGIEVPFKYEVCSTCQGKGSHVNPSIDSHGITQDEWCEWDDEEREGYFSGMYDVECYECGGMRVVPQPDYDRMSDALSKKVADYISDIHQSARDECRAMEMGY